MTKQTRKLVLCLLGGLVLAVAGAAGAAEGWGILTGKGAGTLTLDSGVVLHLDGDTRITDREGNALGVADLVAARHVYGALEVKDVNQLRWYGQRVGDQQVDASRVVLWGEVIQ